MKPVQTGVLAGLLLAVSFLTACEPVELPQSTAIPTQTVWRVRFTPELAWLAAGFSGCLDPQWGVSLVVEETHTTSLNENQADVLLVWGDVDPQGAAAYQIGSDSLAIVAGPDIPLSEISAADLALIYSGGMREWSGLDEALEGEIRAWTYPAHLAVRQVFDESLAGMESASPYLGIAPDVEAMLEAVAEGSSSIGYIPAAWLDERVNRITVPDGNAAVVPVVALTRLEENTQLAAWLECLSKQIPKNP